MTRCFANNSVDRVGLALQIQSDVWDYTTAFDVERRARCSSARQLRGAHLRSVSAVAGFPTHVETVRHPHESRRDILGAVGCLTRSGGSPRDRFRKYLNLLAQQ